MVSRRAMEQETFSNGKVGSRAGSGATGGQNSSFFSEGAHGGHVGSGFPQKERIVKYDWG